MANGNFVLSGSNRRRKPTWTLREPCEMVGRCYRLDRVDQRLERWGFRRKDVVQVSGYKPDALPPVVFIVVPGFTDQTAFIHGSWLGEEVHPLLALASVGQRA